MSAALPRVLFVGAFPPPGRVIYGGHVTSCRELLASTLPRRVRLDLLDSTQVSNPPPRLPVRLLLAAVRVIRFVARLERGRPDAVMLFVGVGASVVEKGAMAWYARIRGVPALLFPRGGAMMETARDSRVSRLCTRVALLGGRRILCQSETWRRFVIEELGFAPTVAVVIRNWTATRDLLEVGSQRTGGRHAPVRLVFVGWVEREKGIFELLAACQHLAPLHEFTLDVVGEGHASGEVRALVARHGLGSVIRFRGWLMEAQLRALLAESDVLVLPSWVEGLPNAMIEGMAARLAIVASSVGAIPDVITHGLNGLLVAPRDVESLQRALGRVMSDRELRERLASEAYVKAACEFSVEPAVERLIGEIAGAITEARAARHGLADHP